MAGQQNSFKHNFLIFCALMRRNIKVLSTELWGTFFDGLVLTIINVIIFGYLFPIAGMKSTLVIPTLLGSLLLVLTSLGASLAIQIVFDLHYNRFIDYHLTLPLPKRWLFASYIANVAIELCLASAPLLVLSLFFLRSYIDLSHAHWLWLIGIYLLGITSYAMMFVSFGFLYPYQWFMDNIWPRRLVPIITIGSMFYPWYAVYNFSPLIGYIFLLNPMTYFAEGLRSSIFGNGLFIPAWVCAVVLIMCILVGLIGVRYSINKQLNPV